MTETEAIALMDEVNAALDAAEKCARASMGAVNWGDLSCRDVEVRTSLIHDTSMIAVTIEEASPDATGLRAFVSAWLEERGWKDVDVETEW